MKKKRVVVTGMGVVSCFGTDVDLFYQQLLEGKSGIVTIPGETYKDYPTRFAGVIPDFDVGHYLDKKQARRVDPFVLYGIVAGKKALEHAQLSGEAFEKLNKARAGILIGSGMGGMNVFYDGVETLLTKGYKRLTPFFVPYIITNMAGALLAIDLGFMGPNYSISTACATANYSIYSAAAHILRGDADLMLCGGSEAAITPIGMAGFVACKALSERNDEPHKASRPWDKARDGFVMGEGAGVLILESLEHALKRGAPILAEYLGGGISCDAHHMTDPRADGLGVGLCVEQAIAQAGIAKEQINYINAHATSTLAGDLCEVRAIHKVFGPHTARIKMNATKSMIGHCLGAAGGIEAIATIKAINTGKIHPTINLDNPEEDLGDIDVVANQAQSHCITAALSNSFGFGGHNSSLLFAPYVPQSSMREVASFGVIPFRKDANGRYQVLLILHSKGSHWGFPKGKADPGETPLQSATRELKEETGLAIVEVLSAAPITEQYQFRYKGEKILKIVHYFPALVSGELKLQVEEVREAKWLHLEEALAQLSFKEARHLLMSCFPLIKES